MKKAPKTHKDTKALQSAYKLVKKNGYQGSFKTFAKTQPGYEAWMERKK